VPYRADLPLERPAGLVHHTGAQSRQDEAAPLVEAERFEVVVRGHERDAVTIDHRSAQRVQKRRTDTAMPFEGCNERELAVLALPPVRDDPDRAAVTLGDETWQREHVDQLAAARLHGPAERVLHKRLRPGSVGVSVIAHDHEARGYGSGLELEGLHHVTCITGDAAQNVDFYTRVLGLRLVKKTVNQDDPTVYHLFYADERGSAGSDITFFEYPNAAQGRPGDGMVHRVAWRIASEDALDFWQERVGGERGEGHLRFSDPEGLEHELAVVETTDTPLVAKHPEIPAELALQGFDGVRAYSADPETSLVALEETLAFRPDGKATWQVRGAERGGFYAYDPAPAAPGVMGAGTVHHVAWSSPMAEHEEWHRRVVHAGLRPSPVIDRFYFRSIYFREPSGVLFEIATLGPGFSADEPQESLGEALSLPPAFEHLRDRLESVLTPLPDPRGPVLP